MRQEGEALEGDAAAAAASAAVAQAAWDGFEVEQGVVGGEVVAVVDPREVVDEGVLEEIVAVDEVHRGVEGHECRERVEDEGQAFVGEEVDDPVDQGCVRRPWPCRGEGPQHARAVDEGVDLEVHGCAEEDAGCGDLVRLKCPEEGHGQHAEEAFAAATGADGGDHGVEEPDAGVLETSFAA